MVVDHSGADGHAAEITLGLAGDLVAHHPVEGMLHVPGIEGGAVREGHTLAQLEPPTAVGQLFPAFGQFRLQSAAAAHIEIGQRFADVLQQRRADGRLRGHAGLQQVHILGHDDPDGPVLPMAAAVRQVASSSPPSIAVLRITIFPPRGSSSMFSESHAAGAADARQQSQAPGCRGAIWTIPQACPAPPTCWCRPRQAMLLTGGAAAEAVLAEMGADGAGVARGMPAGRLCRGPPHHCEIRRLRR